MNNWIIHISLIFSFLLLFLLVLFLLPVMLGPQHLVHYSWLLLYVADRILGGLIPLPPVLSWTVFGFCLGMAIGLFLQDLEQPSRYNRIVRRILLGGVLTWTLAGQLYMHELTSWQPSLQARHWWRPETYRSPGTPRIIGGIELRWIPPGKFLKGSPLAEKGRNIDEVQREIVFHRGYWIGAKEITWKEWLKQMPPPSGHPVPPADRELPVWGVSYEEAEAFCQALSTKVKGTFRLPTESEWEYACRAGTVTAYFFGNNARALPLHACVNGSSSGAYRSEPCRASAARANPWGLMDVHGNVAEWCTLDPVEANIPLYRTHRGGSWQSPPEACRSAARGIHLIDQPPPADVGLRVIWEP